MEMTPPVEMSALRMRLMVAALSWVAWAMR